MLAVTLVQVAPLSRVTWSSPSLVPAQITPFSLGDSAMATAILPTGVVGSPCPVRRFQVVPPSRDMNSPLPRPPLNWPHVLMSICHMPARRIRGFRGSIAMSEAPVFSSTNSTLSQVFPPSTVRKTRRSGCGP